MDNTEIGVKGVGWITVAQDKKRWRVFVKIEMELLLRDTNDLSNSSQNFRFSKRTLHLNSID
jgi:hypothetical protein